MTKIDFTQPLELVDGTPVKLKVYGDGSTNPDRGGDYYLVREDGEHFNRNQQYGYGNDVLIVRPNGKQWLFGDQPPVIRNRQPDFWGPEIEVNGVRPTWLRPVFRTQWYGPGMTDQWWNRNASGGTTLRTLQWGPDITAIRLPADHFAYVAIERGFEPWGGGDSAPEDWDGGDVLRVGNAKFSGERLAQPYYTSPWESNQRWHTYQGTEHGKNLCDIIGYRKKAAPVEEIDWTGDLEAVRISDDFTMPVTLAYGPDDDGDYVTNECPDSSRTNREWRADGSERCFYGKWKVRNRVAAAPKGYEAIGDWVGAEDGQTPVFPADMFYQMRSSANGWVNPRIISTNEPRGGSMGTEYRLLRKLDEPATVTVSVLTEVDLGATMDAWYDYGGSDDFVTFAARRWGLLAPKPETPIERFMAAHPEADRATAELALGWEQGQ